MEREMSTSLPTLETCIERKEGSLNKARESLIAWRKVHADWLQDIQAYREMEEKSEKMGTTFQSRTGTELNRDEDAIRRRVTTIQNQISCLEHEIRALKLMAGCSASSPELQRIVSEAIQKQDEYGGVELALPGDESTYCQADDYSQSDDTFTQTSDLEKCERIMEVSSLEMHGNDNDAEVLKNGEQNCSETLTYDDQQNSDDQVTSEGQECTKTCSVYYTPPAASHAENSAEVAVEENTYLSHGATVSSDDTEPLLHSLEEAEDSCDYNTPHQAHEITTQEVVNKSGDIARYKCAYQCENDVLQKKPIMGDENLTSENENVQRRRNET